MQTVASMAQRLDMSAEKAVQTLQHMLFEVGSVEDQITDEQCDLLIDIDEDASVAEHFLKEKLAVVAKEEKRKERLQKAAKKAAAKRKASAAKKKAAADKKAKTEAKAKAKEETKKKASKKAEDVKEAPEIPEEAPAQAGAEEAPQIEEPPASEPEVPVEVEDAAPEEIEEKAPMAEILPRIEVSDKAEIVEAPDTQEADGEGADLFEEDMEGGVDLAVEEDARPLPKPDPAVVAEVIRRATERRQKAEGIRPGASVAPSTSPRTTAAPPRKTRKELKRGTPAIPTGGAAALTDPKKPSSGRGGSFRGRPGGAGPGAPGRTGKTARKKAKRANRARNEETLRREAAAAVREFETGGMVGGLAAKKRKRKRDQDTEGGAATVIENLIIEVDDTLTVEQLAETMNASVNDLILELMEYNIMANKNQALAMDVIKKIAEPLGFEVVSLIPEEDEVLAEEPDAPEDLEPRAPVITVMGHVDHGKTSLLDHVRAANVAEGEAGGITQHIAAYEVKTAQGRAIFLDTPGHAAFTQMRMRGAQATDVVVLVVAADDGVMPQTVEAIDHAKAAEVPIVVAVNKCDKPDAQPDRLRQELTQYDLLDEQWGGKTIIRNISAKTGDGIDELIELLILETELLELKANPNKMARGSIIESEISRGLGPLAWVLVQQGTLRVGNVFLAGECYGRVRSMVNSRGEQVQEAGPSTPVVVTGFSAPPDAGDTFVVLKEERVAKTIAAKRTELAKSKQSGVRHMTLEDFHARMLAGEKKELNVLIKADVQGSVDVLESSFAKLGNEEVKIALVHSGVGGINESDILLASASDAVIIGFHVTANAKVQKMAEAEGVDVRTFMVIYEAIEALQSALEGMLTPDTKEVVTGHAEVRQIFRSSAFGNIAGSYVQDGEVTRNGLARITRDDAVVYEGKVGTLRREKDDARSVASGYECGIKLERFEDIKVGDIIETYKIEEVAKTFA